MLLLSKYFSAFLAALHPILVRNARLKIFALKAHSRGSMTSPKFRHLKPTRQRGFILRFCRVALLVVVVVAGEDITREIPGLVVR
jgi:hypothetical protein